MSTGYSHNGASSAQLIRLLHLDDNIPLTFTLHGFWVQTIVTEFFLPTPIIQCLSHGSPATVTMIKIYFFYQAFLTLAPIFSIFFLFPDRGKKEIAYLGMFKAKVLVLGPCKVNFLD